MEKPTAKKSFKLWEAVRPLVTLSDHKRPWGFLITVALAVGLPVLVGVWLDEFAYGVLGSLGGLASIYMRQTPLSHRAKTMACVSFGFCISFAIALLAGYHPMLQVLVIGLVAITATFVTRYFAIPPPGSFFFILAACIATAMPFDLSLIPQRTGLVLMGCLGASMLMLGYSVLQLIVLGNTKGVHPGDPTEPRIVAILLEAVTIGSFIALSYWLALAVGLERPYWAPVSCLAVMQGATFRAIWHRNVHRIVGTVIGMGLAWLIFTLQPSLWALAIMVLLLSFSIEVLVTRNYGLAVIFITPLTIVLAEFSSATQDINSVIVLRLVDVVLGSLVGYIGGWVMFQTRFFSRLERRLRRSRFANRSL